VNNAIASGKSSDYRNASEALHRAQGQGGRCAENLRVLWACGLADLIRSDFYALIGLTPASTGDLLDAGCGTGLETRNFAHLAPHIRLHGVDISSVALAEAVSQIEDGVRFYQTALETLPFGESSFNFVTSHEVIEHVEDPAIVIGEFYRVLKPGGVCVIATPNGASVWVEHLRQRLMRLFGRRGAPVGADHTRPPSFWRRTFRQAGFTVERQVFDGAAFEFLTYVAPASWMRPLSRVLEPLRTVPFVNLLLCDRVKFRLSKPALGTSADTSQTPPLVVCPLCHTQLSFGESAAECGTGHRFARNNVALVDFTTTVPPNDANAVMQPTALPKAATRPGWGRRLRRLVMGVGCIPYVGFLGILAPFGLVFGMFYQPLRRDA
jgi:2-polyprenyl-3-methyl-5-hydroxy-6-metoxy-1,4-benzoquinol methylase